MDAWLLRGSQSVEQSQARQQHSIEQAVPTWEKKEFQRRNNIIYAGVLTTFLYSWASVGYHLILA